MVLKKALENKSPNNIRMKDSLPTIKWKALLL